MSVAFVFVILCGLAALGYGIYAGREVLAASAGSARMQEISGAIQEGAQAYLNRQYTTIAVVGVVIGVILGVLGALNVSDLVTWLERLSGQHIFSSDVYFISTLPSELRLDDVVLVSLAALTLSFLATIYPAWRAAQTQPAEALRYE